MVGGLLKGERKGITISFLDGTYFNFEDLIRTESPHLKEFLQPNENVDERYTITSPSMLNALNKVGDGPFMGG